MASQQFPPQKQESQPGKEHLMDPRPEAIIKHYKPANKLQVQKQRTVWCMFVSNDRRASI